MATRSEDDNSRVAFVPWFFCGMCAQSAPAFRQNAANGRAKSTLALPAAHSLS
jgi:hypothetical protein